MYSLNKRLTFSLAGSLVLFFIFQTVMIDREVEKLSEQNLISRLEHDQKSLLAALKWQPPAKPELNQSYIPDIYMRAFSGHYYELTIAGHTFRSRSLWDEKLPQTKAALLRNVAGPHDQLLLILSQSFSVHNKPVTIRIAEDISHLDAMTSTFQGSLLMLAAITVLILLILQSLIIQYGLKPLLRIRQQLGQLERGEIHQITTPAPKEIMPLVTEINHLIILMNKRLERSRHALGDLAHTLKTPLSVIQQIVERQESTVDSIQLQNQLQQIEQRITRELARARTAGQSPGGQWLKPYDDLHELLNVFKKLFPDKTITLTIPKTLKIEADGEDMMEIFGNLLENACKWSDSTVHCQVAMLQDKLLIRIEDDGVGIKPDAYQHLLSRGIRADESKPGHGLGLAIVYEIASAYGGSIELDRSPILQGLQVRITLPQTQLSSGTLKP